MQQWKDNNLSSRFANDSISFWQFPLIYCTQCRTWIMTSVSLVMVAQYNFCNQDFVIAHKFSMGWRSGEFPGQSITFNFCFLKIVFTFLDERHGTTSCWNFPHLEMPFSYLEWLFFWLCQCTCLHSSYTQIVMSESAPEHLILRAFYYLIEMGRT